MKRQEKKRESFNFSNNYVDGVEMSKYIDIREYSINQLHDETARAQIAYSYHHRSTRCFNVAQNQPEAERGLSY